MWLVVSVIKRRACVLNETTLDQCSLPRLEIGLEGRLDRAVKRWEGLQVVHERLESGFKRGERRMHLGIHMHMRVMEQSLKTRIVFGSERSDGRWRVRDVPSTAEKSSGLCGLSRRPQGRSVAAG